MVTQKLLLLMQRAGISTAQSPHSPPLRSPDVSYCPSPPSMIGAAEDAQVLRQMPGMWNLVDSVFFMALFFFFLLDLAPFYRPSGSTHVFVSLSLFYSLCSVLLF